MSFRRRVQCGRFVARRIAFTLPEMLVVIGVIALLIAVLLPALAGGKKTAQMMASQNNLKQISTWMTAYSGENRDAVVPSQFDYSASAASGFPINVRSDASLGPLLYQGTWTDILWTANGLGKTNLVANAATSTPEQYVYDSPNKGVYDADDDFPNPFRSTVSNSRDFPGGDGNALPFGNGATEVGLPGYFAMNNFFKTGPATGAQTYWTNGQIKSPSRSLAIIDSIAGETIEPVAAAFDNPAAVANNPCQVDFRYNGACLMLFLDGHSSVETGWTTMAELRDTRKIKIDLLNTNY